MARFLNKNELIIVMLIILMFDLNGFCDISASYITYENKRAYFGLFLAISFLLFDIFIYKSLVHADQMPTVTYKNNNKHHVNCEEMVIDKVEDHARQLKEIKEVCGADKNNKGHIISEKIVMAFIILVIIVMIISCVYFGGQNENSNSTGMRLLLSIPFMLVTCSISACAVYF